ncbi:MAG: hypothetical protein ACK5YR_02865 [Pirellula sp.]|jgi:hypothetical protein
MNRKLRSTILGCKLNGLPRTWERTHRERFCGLANYPPTGSMEGWRSNDVHESSALIALAHLGYASEIEEIIEAGCDVFLDFFVGEWRDKDNYPVHKKWFSNYKLGLLIAMAANRWDDIRMVSDKIESSFPVDYHGSDDNLDPVTFDIYKRIASKTRTKPFPRLPAFGKLIAKCTTKRGEHLVRMCEAIENADEAYFLSSLKDSLSCLLRSGLGGPISLCWIAIEESTLCMLAHYLGVLVASLEETLTEKQIATILTPETIRT